MQGSPQTEVLWWQKGVVYQIYPRSFMDINGDGVGDLEGIRAKLDYLTKLGIDAIWLSPIYPSPMADFGYDISNYTGIEPVFGTIADFDMLLEDTHRHGLKLILDFVPNHTSDEHPWFKESRASRENPKRDWYFWKDPKSDGSPPNNWVSNFGGSAWQFDETTGQYYLHLFHSKQPDLNWRNPEVREAMYDAMRFWFNKGVDGFRIDVLFMVIKDALFRDNPPNPDWKPGDPIWESHIKLYSEDQPEVHQVVQEMRNVAEEYHERVLIGEIYLPYDRLVRYYGENLDEAHLPFNFQLLLLQDWQARTVESLVDSYESSLPAGAWPNWVLGNHDKTRLVTRIGEAQAKVAQMLLLTLRGTPTCYYGDELGMADVKIPPELAFDPQGKDNPAFSRDPQRTPMQWDDSLNAGFSRNTPWLPVSDKYSTVNVKTESEDPYSFLALFRKLLQIRRNSLPLTLGDYEAITTGNDQLFVYLRIYEEQKVLIILNFSHHAQSVKLDQLGESAVIACSTHMDLSGKLNLAEIELRADEGLVLMLG